MIKIKKSKKLDKQKKLLKLKQKPLQEMRHLPKRKRNLKHNYWLKNLRLKPIEKQLLRLKNRQKLNSKETLPKRDN